MDKPPYLWDNPTINADEAARMAAFEDNHLTPGQKYHYSVRHIAPHLDTLPRKRTWKQKLRNLLNCIRF